MRLRGAIAALATRHGKDRVIAPVLARSLGLDVRVAAVDTDRFGTLDGEVPRLSTPLATAKAKASAAFVAMPDAELALASVGTFGPLPGMPIADQELLLLVDRTGRFHATGTACGAVWHHGEAVDSVVAAEDAAERLAFPTFGVIVVAVDAGRPVPLLGIHRDIRTLTDVRDAAADLIARRGMAWIEPDRRANRNPRRMGVIARAAEDLERRLLRGPLPSTDHERAVAIEQACEIERRGA